LREAQFQAAAAADDAPGAGEEPQPEPFGFPAAGGAGEGEHLRPGQQFAGQRDDLAPDLVLGEPGRWSYGPSRRPAGEPLVASDVYGSRRLVMAPFSGDGRAPDHWYAWDIDLCWIAVVAGAGVFASAQDALREWRDAVGPAASGAALSSCPAGMTAQLLGPCLRTGPLADMLQGNEPRDLIREYYRLRRRARDLTGSADTAAGSSPFDAGHAPDAFLNWYATRHDDVPAAMTEAAATIYEEWGPHEYPDERSFYACSPHRLSPRASGRDARRRPTGPGPRPVLPGCAVRPRARGPARTRNSLGRGVLRGMPAIGIGRQQRELPGPRPGREAAWPGHRAAACPRLSRCRCGGREPSPARRARRSWPWPAEVAGVA
jgi:hypothetical protein